MSDSVRPHSPQPTRLPRPWDSPGKNTGVGCHFLLQCMKVKSESEVSVLATPWTAAYQAPPSMGFSRQECWTGVPLPSPLNMPSYFLIIFSYSWVKELSTADCNTPFVIYQVSLCTWFCFLAFYSSAIPVGLYTHFTLF